MTPPPIEKSTLGHAPPITTAFIVLRSLQLLLAVVILGLSGYLTSKVPTGIDDPASFALTLFTAIATLIILGYIIISTFFFHAIYNVWAFLAVDIFAVIFWLSSMATMAAFRAAFIYPTVIYYKRDFHYKRDFWVAVRTALNVMTGTAVLSAFEFVLFVVTLVLISIHLHKLLRGGKVENTEANPTGVVQQQQAAVPLSQESHAAVPVPQAYQSQPQQQYPPQSYTPQPYDPNQQQQQQQQYAPQYQQPQGQYQQPYYAPSPVQQQYAQPPMQSDQEKIAVPNNQFQTQQQNAQQPLQSDQEKIAVEQPASHQGGVSPISASPAP